MKKAIANRTFRRSDNHQIVHMSKEIEGEDAYIDELVRNRMARYVSASMAPPEVKVTPLTAASTSWSASPAGPAVTVTTSKKSVRGGRKSKKKKDAE